MIRNLNVMVGIGLLTTGCASPGCCGQPEQAERSEDPPVEEMEGTLDASFILPPFNREYVFRETVGTNAPVEFTRTWQQFGGEEVNATDQYGNGRTVVHTHKPTVDSVLWLGTESADEDGTHQYYNVATGSHPVLSFTATGGRWSGLFVYVVDMGGSGLVEVHSTYEGMETLEVADETLMTSRVHWEEWVFEGRGGGEGDPVRQYGPDRTQKTCTSWYASGYGLVKEECTRTFFNKHFDPPTWKSKHSTELVTAENVPPER